MRRVSRSCEGALRAGTDKDGRMTAADLQRELERLGLPFTQKTITDILAVCDKDLDGHISFDDFYHFCIEKARERLKDYMLPSSIATKG